MSMLTVISSSALVMLEGSSKVRIVGMPTKSVEDYMLAHMLEQAGTMKR